MRKSVVSSVLVGLVGAGFCAVSRGQVCFNGTSSACGVNPTPVAIGDLNGDQRLDVVVGNLSAGTVSVLLNNGAGFNVAVPYGAGDEPWGVAVGDLNGDQVPDLVVANYGALSSNIQVRFNLGNGTFGPAVTLLAGARPITPVAIDVDGDLDNDIVVANFVGNSFSVLKNNGNGTFAAAVSYPAGTAPQGLACADLNGDQRPDVVTCDINGDTVSVFMNNGDGTYGARQPYPMGNEPYYCVLADLDGDGDRDMAVSIYNGGGSGVVTVMKNNGNGTFSSAQNYPVADGPIGIASADFDGDCDTDVLVSHYTSNVATIMRNDGSGGFASRPTTATSGPGYGAATGDIDGDGSPDGVIAARLSNFVSVLHNGCWVIAAQPGDATVCPNGTAQFSVTGNGATGYAWRKDGVALSDGTTGSGSVVSGAHAAALSIGNCSGADEGLYDCIVSTGCNSRTSDDGVLKVCPPDYDCDGFVTGADYDNFVQAFENGDMSADFDGDGFITGVDFDLYVQSFESGC